MYSMRFARVGCACYGRPLYYTALNYVATLRNATCSGSESSSSGACGDSIAVNVDTIASIKEDAIQKGFVSRDTLEGRELIASQYAGRESISGGDVTVINLPAETGASSEFDKYTRSTTDFTSYITPFGAPTGSGLGAGFSSAPEKRLGFLRPRRTVQPFAGLGSPLQANVDEKGAPVKGDVMKRTDIIKRRAEYMRSFEGSAICMQEHSLLADLDFNKDAVLFGHTREEFERNVTKLKNVILAYSRWERTDNLYRYCTWFLKLLTAWTLMDCISNYYNLQLFAANYDLFVEVIADEIAELEAHRARDMASAAAEVHNNPPDFEPVLAAIRAEKELVIGSASQRAVEADGQQQSQDSNNRSNAEGRTPHRVLVQGAGDTKVDRDIHALLISGKQTDTAAKADCSQVGSAVTGSSQEAHLCVGEDNAASAMMNFTHKSSLFANNSIGDSTSFSATSTATTGADDSTSGAECKDGKILLSVPDRASSNAFHPLDTTHEEYFREKAYTQEQNVNMNAMHTRVAQTDNYHMVRALWRSLRMCVSRGAAHVTGASFLSASAPVESLNLDDLVTYSYAASPTSIASARAVRRILLPRSEDYTQVVREEMAEHKASKSKQCSM